MFLLSKKFGNGLFLKVRKKVQETSNICKGVIVCIMPNEQCFSYIMARTSYIQWDDVYYVLDQHT